MPKLLLFLLILLIFISCNRDQNRAEQQHKSTAVKQDTFGEAPAVPGAESKSFSRTEASHEDILDLPLALRGFVPSGYTAIDTASGDLNLDAYPDMILVLKQNGEDTLSDVVEHPSKRPLLILTGTPTGTYNQAARSDNAVYCIDCGGMMGDPFMGLSVKNGYFSIEHYGGSGWRWSRIVTFRYSPSEKSWFLHKDGGDHFHTADPESVETKVRTTKDFGVVPFAKFDIYAED